MNTITIKMRTAALALALLCVLAGLAIGQLTQANSVGGSGTAQLNAINSKLGKISGQLGASQFGGGLSADVGELEVNLEGKLKAIAKSTETLCRESTRLIGVC